MVTAGRVAVAGATAICPDSAALEGLAPAEDGCPGADPELPVAAELEVLCPGADPECPGEVEVVVDLEGLLECPGAEPDFSCAVELAVPCRGAAADFPCPVGVEALWPGAEPDFPCAAAVPCRASIAERPGAVADAGAALVGAAALGVWRPPAAAVAWRGAALGETGPDAERGPRPIKGRAAGRPTVGNDVRAEDATGRTAGVETWPARV